MEFLNFEDRPFNAPAFEALVDVAVIERMKLEEERAQQRNSISPPKSDVAGDNKFFVGDDEASKKTAASPVAKISEQLPTVDFELMSSGIQETVRKSHIKKGKKPISSSPVTKRKTYMQENQDLEFDEEQRIVDEEWVPVPQKPPKKTRKNLNNACGDGIKRKNPLKQQPTQCADPPPDLPEEFKNKIRELNGTEDGTEVTLLIQKTLFKTDLSKQHNRLSMPLKQIKKPDFLRECEIQQLKKGLNVTLIHQPSCQATDIVFCKWDMKKKRGDPSSCYILRRRWMKVVDKNQLKVRDVIQVWSFRVEGRLWVALVQL